MDTPSSLVHYISYWAKARPEKAALHAKREGRWQAITWAEYDKNVSAIARALIARGLAVGDALVIAGANHPEWVQLEFGAMAARGVPAPIYGNATVAQTGYIASDSEARIVACEGAALLAKFLNAEALPAADSGHLEGVTTYITFFPIAETDPGFDDSRVVSFEALLSEGQALESASQNAELISRMADIEEQDTCIRIYTSGTTGVPKGVNISHRGVLHVGQGLLAFEPRFGQDIEYHTVSYLPLSHQAEQLLTNVLSLMLGGEVYFCPEIPQVKDYLVDVRPTAFLGVPRVWEKFESALRGRLGEATGLKAKLTAWAMSTELACFHEQLKRGLKSAEYMPIKRRVARALVIDKVKAALGLDRLEVAVTGSAPISKTTQEFFASLGIVVYEVYGLTETSGAATITDPRKPAFGTVGKPFPGIEIRIGDEDEIQLLGPNNVEGYHGLEDETNALFTEDGWLKTGDAGTLDSEGNLKITGRLKELLITAGAKNVAPIELEFYLQSIVGVGQAMVVGDRKPFLGALLTLDPEGLEPLSKAAGTTLTDMATLAADPKVRAFLEAEIEAKCNSKVARYQTIKKFAILSEEFGIERGELTASMKLRRKTILENQKGAIEAFYVDGTLATPLIGRP